MKETDHDFAEEYRKDQAASKEFRNGEAAPRPDKQPCAQRILKVGSREIVVESTPNRGWAFSKSLHCPHERLLILKPTPIQKVLAVAVPAWVLVSCGAFCLHDPLWGWDRHVWLLAGMIGGVFTFGVALWAIVWPIARSYEFDLDDGQMRTRSLKGQSERPLTDVLAVQIIRGLNSGYELNLVLDDESRRRLTLSAAGDEPHNWAPRRNWASFREQGTLLAKFLGVPLLEEDEICGLI